MRPRRRMRSEQRHVRCCRNGSRVAVDAKRPTHAVKLKGRARRPRRGRAPLAEGRLAGVFVAALDRILSHLTGRTICRSTRSSAIATRCSRSRRPTTGALLIAFLALRHGHVAQHPVRHAVRVAAGLPVRTLGGDRTDRGGGTIGTSLLFLPCATCSPTRCGATGAYGGPDRGRLHTQRFQLDAVPAPHADGPVFPGQPGPNRSPGSACEPTQWRP